MKNSRKIKKMLFTVKRWDDYGATFDTKKAPPSTKTWY